MLRKIKDAVIAALRAISAYKWLSKKLSKTEEASHINSESCKTETREETIKEDLKANEVYDDIDFTQFPELCEIGSDEDYSFLFEDEEPYDTVEEVLQAANNTVDLVEVYKTYAKNKRQEKLWLQQFILSKPEVKEEPSEMLVEEGTTKMETQEKDIICLNNKELKLYAKLPSEVKENPAVIQFVSFLTEANSERLSYERRIKVIAKNKEVLGTSLLGVANTLEPYRQECIAGFNASTRALAISGSRAKNQVAKFQASAKKAGINYLYRDGSRVR